MEAKNNRTVWVEPQQQLGAYVAWVNSQLKKKAGVHLIEDLRNDMRDGVVFTDIIDIVAKERISGIYEVPATYEEMRHNIDLVLKFMASHHIKMHRIRPTDIVEGNLKAIMRVILALAAHYKPMSVRHSSHSSSHPSSRSSVRRQSVMDIAQGASAALTEARRNAKKAGRRSSRYQESSSDACSDGDQPPQRPVSGRLEPPSPGPERGQLDGCSADNSPVSSPRSSFCLPEGTTMMTTSASSATAGVGLEGQEVERMSVDSGLPLGWEDGHLETIRAVKKQLMQLQELILENGTDSGVEGGTTSPPGGLKKKEGREGGSDPHPPPSAEEWVMVRSQLQQATMVNQELREELSLLRSHCLQLQGTKAGLQQRLGEQDAMLSQLKSDKLHLEIELQTTAAENASLRKQRKNQVGQKQGDILENTEPRDQTIIYLRGELARRERMINRLHQEITHPQVAPSSDQVQMRRSCPPPQLLDPHQELGPEENVANDGNVTPELRPASLQPRKYAVPDLTGGRGDGPKTTVLYFTDFSQQPTACAISGRLGEIRLRDFKKLFEDRERYRYYFKALDPEYGTVREELTREDAVVPGWEDKIVAWVETETGTPC